MVSPNEEEEKPIETTGTPTETAESPRETPQPPPAKRKRSLIGRLFSTLILLALVAVAGGYAAIFFKDQDERLKLVADAIEPYFAQGETEVAGLKDRIFGLLGEEKLPAPAKQATPPAEAPAVEAEAPREPSAPSAEAAPEPPRAEPESEPEPRQAETSPEPPAQEPAPPPAEPPRAEAAPEPTPAPAPAVEAEKPTGALEARVEALEESARKALAAAEAAHAAAEAAQTAARTAAETAAEAATNAAKASEGAKPAEGAFSAKDQLTALEGRIDELGEEIKALRERFDSPKNETRAAPETSAAAQAPDAFAAITVVATKLQHDLEAGRPYVHEMTALERLGADPTALAALSPFAEKGAPTASHLRAEFAQAAKKIRALESEHSTGDIGERLLKGASKLVRVHPSGQTPAQTTDEKLVKIDADLAHGDLVAAQTLFASLPEAAQSQAKEFGEALKARVEAARAIDELLHGAVAAIGGARK